MVGGNPAETEGNPQPSTGCCQTYPLRAREEVSMNWARTHSKRISENE